MNAGKSKLIVKNLFIGHRDYFNNFEFRKGGGDNLASEIFNLNYISLEISHGSLSKDNFFTMIVKNNYNNKILLKKKFNNYLRIFKYIIILFYFSVFLKKNNYTFNTLLCIDPISALIGIFIKKKKSSKLIFHITDYSEKRFFNPILNSIYQLIFRYSLFFCDYATSPSKKLIKKFGRKIFHIPNIPKVKSKGLYKNKKNYVLMLIPKIDEGIDLEIILDALEILKNKKKEIKFLITGLFDNKILKNKILNKIEGKFLKKNIIFLGLIKNEKQITKLLNKSKIGITSYKITNKHNYYDYSDSLKIRQYAEFALPVLTEGYTPLAQEVVKNKFGFVFKNSKILSKRIEEIIFKNKFNSLSKNSKLWGLRNSDKKYLKKFKKKFFNSNI